MKREFRVTGMSCASCALHVENAVRGVEGVLSVVVSLLTDGMTVEFESPATEDRIVAAVTRAGYGASPVEPGKEPIFDDAPRSSGGIRLLVSALLTLPLFWLAMGHMIGLPIPPFPSPHEHPFAFMTVQMVLAYAVAVINSRFFTGGFLALIRRAPNMDSLVMLGSGASLLHGTVSLILALIGGGERAAELSTSLYFDAAAMILTLVTLGKTLEGRAKRRTTAAIRALTALSPATATVRRDGVPTVIPAPYDNVNLSEMISDEAIPMRPETTVSFVRSVSSAAVVVEATVPENASVVFLYCVRARSMDMYSDALNVVLLMPNSEAEPLETSEPPKEPLNPNLICCMSSASNTGML